MQVDGQIDLKTVVEIVQAVFTGLMALIAWFFRRTVRQLEKDIKRNEDQGKSIPKMETSLKLLKKDIEFIMHESKFIRQMSEDVAVLKRDQKSIWTRLDEIRGMAMARGKRSE